MKKLLLIICLFAASCNMPMPKNNDISSSDSTSVTEDYANADSTTVSNPSKVESWNYREEVDEMDGKKSYFADCISVNTLYLKSPYDGGSTFKLRVQKYSGSTDVVLYANPGQFLSGLDNDKSIRIKFDDEKPFYINCGEPSDGSANVIFLYPAKKIIAKLKKAKNVIIEPEFYNDGYQQVKFNVAGLDWKH